MKLFNLICEIYDKLSLKTRTIISLIFISIVLLVIFVFTGNVKSFVMNIFGEYLKCFGIVFLFFVFTCIIKIGDSFFLALIMILLSPVIITFRTIRDLINLGCDKIHYKISPDKDPNIIKRRQEETKNQANLQKQMKIEEIGKKGENEVANELNKIQNNIVLQNVYLPINKENTKYTEVDAISINKAGIYVIEVKNYTGKIIGDKNSNDWTKITGNDSHQFYNPLMQNQNHIELLKRYLPGFDSKIQSLIVFGNNADISSIKNIDPNGRIINTSEIRKTIGMDTYGCPSLLTDEEIERINNKLQQCLNVSEEAKKEHLDYINKKYGSEK